MDTEKRAPLTDWFGSAKLGLMLSWGVFSVPGWAPIDPRLTESLGGQVKGSGGAFAHMSPLATTSYSEWYQNSMNLIGSPTWLYHQARYGGLPYDAFVEPFQEAAEQCDVVSWADLARDAGAKYVIPLTKFHDGFMLYPSRVGSPWKKNFALKRDLIGDLSQAVRSRNIEFGAYYSGGIDWTAAGLPLYSEEHLTGALVTSRSGNGLGLWPAGYAEYAVEHYLEIIERYSPSILWNDIGFPATEFSDRVFDAFYQAVPHGVVNDRFDSPQSDFSTHEYQDLASTHTGKWETVRGVGGSFGYNRAEGKNETLQPMELVRLLIRVVARNGNLLLGVGPDEYGRVSTLQAESLRGMGAWLEQNGDAIFGTRPWDHPQDVIEGGIVHWTQNGGMVFALVDSPATRFRLPVKARSLDIRGSRFVSSDIIGAIADIDGDVTVSVTSAPEGPYAIAFPIVR
jgi:alpha-L-fucosidase